jgi:hypothetical protein
MVILQKLCLTFLFVCSWPLLASAQTVDVIAKIGNVKRDTTYLYAEATMKEREQAFKSAYALLSVKVKEWLLPRCHEDSINVYVAKATKNSMKLTASRGDYCRAFVYVKKSDILPALQTVMTVEEAFPHRIVHLTDEEKQMTAISRFYDIEPYVKRLKAEGRVKAYGKYVTMPQGERCHVFIYDQKGDIKAVLRVLPDSQLNLNTLRDDNIRNYTNCGAFWLQLKDK